MSIAVLDKAFSLVEVLSRTARPIILVDLAEESWFPDPAAYRVLRSLRNHRHMLQIDWREAHRLSARPASLSAHVYDQVVRNKALPLMRPLHEAFDETVRKGSAIAQKSISGGINSGTRRIDIIYQSSLHTP
jgi:DNA-binding IclR family transcriptional regulator